TVLADDPALTARPEHGEFLPPLRVVLDARLRTLDCVRVREGGAPTLYLHDPALAAPVLAGVEFVPSPLQADGRFDLAAVMALLAARGINEVHVEAGPTLCGALLQAGLVDELLLYIAPLLMGDAARPLLAGLGIATMAQTVPLELADVRMLGKDLRLLLRPV
ncbi:RibD family protein, partial [Stenotrophomonas pictorum]